MKKEKGLWKIILEHDCGCQIRQLQHSASAYSCVEGYTINYCPKHKAAEDMYEALKDIIEQAEKSHLPIGVDLADSIRVFGKQALSKAETP